MAHGTGAWRTAPAHQQQVSERTWPFLTRGPARRAPPPRLMWRSAPVRLSARHAPCALRAVRPVPMSRRLPIAALSRPPTVLCRFPVQRRLLSSFSGPFDPSQPDGLMSEFMLESDVPDAAVPRAPATSVEDPEPTEVSTPPIIASPPAASGAVAPPKPRPTRTPLFADRPRGTFVSSHYKIDDSDIRSYLDRKSMQYRLNSNEVIVKFCNFCPDHKDKQDNLWKLYISRETGAWLCHRCGKSGSWFDLKRSLGDLKGALTSWDEQREKGPVRELPMPSQKLLAALPAALKKYPDAIVYLTTTRGLQPSVIKHYKVGATLHSFPDKDNNWTEQLCITFPWITNDKEGNQTLVRYKLRALHNKSNQRIEPKGGAWGLFGWHTIPADCKEIILTEGEYDAMAVYQATKMPTVSLPNGCRSLPIEVLPMLERFEKIYLWMDDDEPGQEGAQKFAHKLGVERCWFVSTKDGDPKGPKDANDALRAGKDLKALLTKAAKLRHSQIMTFDEMRSTIYNEIANPRTTAGIQSLTLPSLNRILKGHRRGELTIVTGPTGIGKTSLLSQMSLDYAMQGVNTLWGSFEIKNTRLAKKMLTQFAAKDLGAVPKEEFDRVCEQFSQLPLYFLRFFGSTQLEQVLDAMEYAVYAHDVEHVVLDNLQFLLSGQGVGFERFELQDKAIEAFRKFATLKNVHISLVIHPRKTEEDSPLTHASVFGTAKATQEADNVLILQRGRAHKYLEVKKNRFDGELGNIPLRFEKDSNKFYEVPAEQLTPAPAAAQQAKKPPAERKPRESNHMSEFPV